MPTPADFLTRSLRAHPRGEAVAHILATAIQAVDPAEAVRRFVKREANNQLIVDGKVYDLGDAGRISILGIGKAALAMTLPLAEMLADHSPRGLLIPKQAPANPLAGFDLQPGGHPVPDENSLRAGEKVLTFARGMTVNDLLICLISGGGSALVTAPCESVTLGDMQALTSALLACGARIDEINTLRRHLDRLKGGGLAKLASPAKVISLILSDVVGNLLETIASGPTAPDPSTRENALDILYRYHLQKKVPHAILDALNNSTETPKPGDLLFENIQNVLVGSNQLAAQAALAQARREGFTPILLGNDWQGEARETTLRLCDILRTQSDTPACLVAGGETTITLRGGGLGGRNQELALAAVNELADLPGTLLVTLATDGEDGPTDAAGAVVTPETAASAKAQGLDAAAYLQCNDSYNFFNKIGDLLKIGPTGTNVNDLTFLFKF